MAFACLSGVLRNPAASRESAPFGFHIAEIRSKAPGGGIAELCEVEDTIRYFLTAKREQDAARQVAERLRAPARIRRISARESQI